MKICSVKGCNNKHHGKGYCSRHYQQYKKYGNIIYSGRSRLDPNEIIEYEDYAEMILYDKDNNEIARAIIDLECIELVKKCKWCLLNGYVHSNEFGRLHRYLMDCPDGLVIDHINHNPLDNRRNNLRICTQQENDFNKSIQSNNTSGIPGVYFVKNRNKWQAQIKINRKNIFLGYFKTKEEAAEARRQAEIEYFGEYAPTNN